LRDTQERRVERVESESLDDEGRELWRVER
jgi:hypothetical protein